MRSGCTPMLQFLHIELFVKPILNITFFYLQTKIQAIEQVRCFYVTFYNYIYTINKHYSVYLFDWFYKGKMTMYKKPQDNDTFREALLHSTLKNCALWKKNMSKCVKFGTKWRHFEKKNQSVLKAAI